MKDEDADDLEERRRVGRELQARLPKPRRRSKNRPVVDNAGDATEIGCLAAEIGPVGVLLAAGGTIVWFLTKRRRAT